jgi:hypothetical protein
MLRTSVLLLFTVVRASFVGGEAPNTATHIDHARIQHGPHSATVTAKEARPLDQTVVAMRGEYGWLVDYEDPVYSGSDLTPVTDDDWHSQFQRAPGLMRPAGREFYTTYQESADMNTDQARSGVLRQTINDYMHSGNPGTFSLIQTAPGRFAVVGRNYSSTPVLDTLVTVDLSGEIEYRALADVLQSVQATTGHKMGLGLVPTNILARCSMNQDFNNTPARKAILAIFNSCQTTLLWQLLYDANQDTFLLNLSPPASLTGSR